MNKFVKKLTRERSTLKVSINWIKISCWTFWLWLVVSLFISVSDQVTDVSWISFKGDHGFLVLITVLVAFLVPLFVQDKKNDNLIGGLTLLVFSLVTFVGTLITKPTGITAIVWTTPLAFLAIIGLFWFVNGLKVNPPIATSVSNANDKKNYQKIPAPNFVPEADKNEGETFKF